MKREQAIFSRHETSHGSLSGFHESFRRGALNIISRHFSVAFLSHCCPHTRESPSTDNRFTLWNGGQLDFVVRVCACMHSHYFSHYSGIYADPVDAHPRHLFKLLKLPFSRANPFPPLLSVIVASLCSYTVYYIESVSRLLLRKATKSIFTLGLNT